MWLNQMIMAMEHISDAVLLGGSGTQVTRLADNPRGAQADEAS